MEEAGDEEGEQGLRLGGVGDGADGEEEVARGVVAPQVLELSSSSSGEEGGSWEEEESQGSVEVTRGGGGDREARVSESRDSAEVNGGEAESQSLPGCPICMNAWTADGAHRQVLSLREKNESLEKQNQELVQEINEHKRQIILQQNFINESSLKRKKMADQSSHGTTDADSVASLTADDGHSSPCSFVLQNEFFLDGARVMGIDASSQIILTSGRAPGIGAEHVLTKAPGWSCSGDQNSPNHIYAGLQNGMLLTFDIRQTVAPLHSMMGLSTHPVHTIHSVVDGGGSRKVISASSIGPCIWDVDGSRNRPDLLNGMENHGVCISLACNPPSSDLLVASFRPKVELSDDGTSQAGKSQSPTPSASGKLGCHALIRRTSNTSFARDQICRGNVSGLRMSKSAIIPFTGRSNQQHLFAYGDESLRGVRTWRLPSLQTFADLRPHRQPILDLRFAESSSTGERYLGCLSEDRLQVFRVR
ncbi:Os10g0545600 [Oryza sativa Japonica Group]|uniref:RING-type E3 ubiquitin transferase n=1 Tax=Oryza sativa subsp. japonica TaxID=39947 RepID=Q0IVZ1_ORYSJ|nr:Os10g0545600 [Oryza sativa Japonica Group]|eukprot:NP_001065210.2 Os10g0545600 [Oryza sativa Japonica Group]